MHVNENEHIRQHHPKCLDHRTQRRCEPRTLGERVVATFAFHGTQASLSAAVKSIAGALRVCLDKLIPFTCLHRGSVSLLHVIFV